MPNAGDIIRASDVAVQACRVTRTAVQSIPDNTETQIAFTAEVFDNDNMHDTVTNNTRITINTAGFYVVGFTGILSGSNYVRSYAGLRINDGFVIARGAQVVSTSFQQVSVQTVYQFAVGDYVEAEVFQDNTDNTNRDVIVFSEASPIFYAARVGS